MTIERREDHWYRRVEQLDPDGPPAVSDWVPGITTVVGMLPKPLAQWGANLVAKKATDWLISDDTIDVSDPDALYQDLRKLPERTSERAADIGTRVHKAAEDHAAGQEVLFEDDIKPYLQQFERGFIDRYQPTFIESEFMVWGGEYGGTGDVIADIEGARWLIDYKTSTKRITHAMSGFPYPDTALQLAALKYADLIGDAHDERSVPDVDHCGVVAITPTECELIEYDVGPEEIDTFFSLLDVHTWTRTRKKEVKR